MFNPINAMKDITNDGKGLTYNDIAIISLTLFIITPLLWFIECLAWLEYKISSKVEKRLRTAEKEVKTHDNV